MSLINEALKRAKRAQVRHPVGIASDPVLQPVIKSAPPINVKTWWIPISGGVVLLLSFWFLFAWWRQSSVSPRTAPVAKRSTNTLVAAMNAASAVAAKVSSQRQAAAADEASAPVPAQEITNRLASVPTQAPAAAEVSPTNSVSAAGPVEPVKPGAGQARATNEVVVQPPMDTTPVNFKLEGIFYRKSRASALIDGRPVFVGDEIEGAKVVSIDRQSVRLLRSGRTIVLKLR